MLHITHTHSWITAAKCVFVDLSCQRLQVFIRLFTKNPNLQYLFFLTPFVVTEKHSLWLGESSLEVMKCNSSSPLLSLCWDAFRSRPSFLPPPPMPPPPPKRCAHVGANTSCFYNAWPKAKTASQRRYSEWMFAFFPFKMFFWHEKLNDFRKCLLCWHSAGSTICQQLGQFFSFCFLNSPFIHHFWCINIFAFFPSHFYVPTLPLTTSPPPLGSSLGRNSSTVSSMPPGTWPACLGSSTTGGPTRPSAGSPVRGTSGRAGPPPGPAGSFGGGCPAWCAAAAPHWPACLCRRSRGTSPGCPRKRQPPDPPARCRKIWDRAVQSRRSPGCPRIWWRAVLTGEGGLLVWGARQCRGRRRQQAGGGGAAGLGARLLMKTLRASLDWKVSVPVFGVDAPVDRSTPLKRPAWEALTRSGLHSQSCSWKHKEQESGGKKSQPTFYQTSSRVSLKPEPRIRAVLGVSTAKEWTLGKENQCQSYTVSFRV